MKPRVEHLDDVTQRGEIFGESTPPALSTREGVRQVRHTTLRTNTLNRLDGWRALGNLLGQVESYDIHTFGGLHFFTRHDPVRVRFRHA